MKDNKYNEYKRAAAKLEEIISALTQDHRTVSTIENVPGLAKLERLHIDKSSGQIVVIIWEN